MNIDCDKLSERIQSFNSDYFEDFNNFWNRKNKIEKVTSILDPSHSELTYFLLRHILSSWQTYRNSSNLNPLETLKESLTNIRQAYSRIKKYSLLELDKVPEKDLEYVWHKLGRVKQPEGKTNSRGKYNVIAVCKPLMLLWGQTMAFDRNVRYNISGMNIRIDQYRWSFEKWHDAMLSFSEYLNDTPKVTRCIEEVSYKLYGEKAIVPYGRFLDIYFFGGT